MELIQTIINKKSGCTHYKTRAGFTEEKADKPKLVISLTKKGKEFVNKLIKKGISTSKAFDEAKKKGYTKRVKIKEPTAALNKNRWLHNKDRKKGEK